MNQIELKPCPFCGGKADFSVGKTGDGKDWHYIECDDCGAMGPHVNYADHMIQVKEANAEAWNARTDAAIAHMESALRLALEYWAHRQQRYKNRRPAWVEAAHAALDRTKSA